MWIKILTTEFMKTKMYSKRKNQFLGSQRKETETDTRQNSLYFKEAFIHKIGIPEPTIICTKGSWSYSGIFIRDNFRVQLWRWTGKNRCGSAFWFVYLTRVYNYRLIRNKDPIIHTCNEAIVKYTAYASPSFTVEKLFKLIGLLPYHFHKARPIARRTRQRVKY